MRLALLLLAAALLCPTVALADASPPPTVALAQQTAPAHHGKATAAKPAPKPDDKVAKALPTRIEPADRASMAAIQQQRLIVRLNARIADLEAAAVQCDPVVLQADAQLRARYSIDENVTGIGADGEIQRRAPPPAVAAVDKPKP